MSVKPLSLERFFSTTLRDFGDPKMLSATFHNLEASFIEPKIWRSKWEAIECPDGRRVQVLKDAKDAFEAYGGRWKSSFNFLIDIFEKIKFQFDTEIKQEISNISEAIKVLDDNVKTQFIGAYNTFRLTACHPDSADRLWKMTEDINEKANELMTLIISTNKIQDEEGVKALKEAVKKLEEIIKANKNDNKDS